MSCIIRYKWKSIIGEGGRVTFDGNGLLLWELKDEIYRQQKLSKAGDFDIVVINAQSNEEYTDEHQMIPRNTNVLVKRVPLWMLTSGQYYRTQKNQQYPTGIDKNIKRSFVASDDLKSMTQEEKKIRAMAQASSESWQQQLELQESFGTQRADMKASTGIKLQTAPPKIQPAPGYICHRCGEKGHYISDCPLFLSNPGDKTRLKRAAGIPKTFLQAAASDGSELRKTMLSQDGSKVIYRPNQHEWNKLHAMAAKTKEHIEEAQTQEQEDSRLQEELLMDDEEDQQVLRMLRERQPGVH